VEAITPRGVPWDLLPGGRPIANMSNNTTSPTSPTRSISNLAKNRTLVSNYNTEHDSAKNRTLVSNYNTEHDSMVDSRVFRSVTPIANKKEKEVGSKAGVTDRMSTALAKAAEARRRTTPRNLTPSQPIADTVDDALTFQKGMRCGMGLSRLA